MRRNKRTVSRSVGIEVGAICSKYFFKSQHLHYGYWTSDLEVDVANVRAAQENYAKFLITHIPDGVQSILDVGCGAGRMAQMLADLGYRVDCVSPSSYLGEQARQLLGAKSIIFECFYEELETPNRYDLVLFSESFQYINPEDAINKTLRLLNEGGYVLICDIFKKNTPGKSLLPGGHPLTRFYDTMLEYPLEPVEDVDITEQTAPTLDIVNEVFNEVVKPSVDLAQQLADNRYPLMSRFLRFLYKKKINKLNKKYFSGVKTGANFKKFKSYRLLLYRRRSLANARQVHSPDGGVGTADSDSQEQSTVSGIKALGRSKRFDRFVNKR